MSRALSEQGAVQNPAVSEPSPRRRTGFSPTGVVVRLIHLWGTSPSNMIAVGGQGLVARYDGVRWTVNRPPTRYDLSAVWGSSAGNIYVAGQAGTILHHCGTER